MAKRKGNDETRVGSYLFSIQNNSNGSWLVARTVSGLWSIRWNEGHMMYGILCGLLADERCHKYVEALMTMIYTASSYPHDEVAIINKQELPFINGFARLIQEQADFETSVKEKATEQEDAEALEETAHLQELQDELEALDNDEVH